MSDKPALSVSLEVENNPVNIDDSQRLIVSVKNSTTGPGVKGAIVTGELIDPSGDDIKLENVVTNASGQTSYSWTIDDNYESGNYTAYVTVTVGDSEPKTVFREFNVTNTQ